MSPCGNASALNLATFLVKAKNRRLDVERTPDNTVVDLVSWLCELGFTRHRRAVRLASTHTGHEARLPATV